MIKALRYSVIATLVAGTALATATRLPADTTTTPTTAAKTTRPKSRTENKATLASVTANSLQVTTKEGALDVALTAQTEYWRVEDNLQLAELKVGDMVAFPLRGTDNQPTISSLAPLSLKFGDVATLTFNKTDKMTLDRLTTIKPADLAAGQNVSVAMNVLPDGKLEAKRVTVIIAKPKAVRAPKEAKTPKD